MLNFQIYNNNFLIKQIRKIGGEGEASKRAMKIYAFYSFKRMQK